MGEKKLAGNSVHLQETGDDDGDVVSAAFGVGGADQLLAGGFQTAGQLKNGLDLFVGKHAVKPVGTEHHLVAWFQVGFYDVNIYPFAKTKGPGDHVPYGGFGSFLPGYQAAFNLFLND